MKKILITGKISQNAVNKLSKYNDYKVDFKPDIGVEELKKIISIYDCLITRSETNVSRELIDIAENLKVIAVAAVGYAHIDVEYATQKGILVFNSPGLNTNSAAELTLALILACARKIIPAHKNMEKLLWDRHKFSGMELMGKTIGIIGLGNVGHRVAQFCNGLEMKVLSYDPYIPDEKFNRCRVIKSDLKTLLQNSDIISVHVPKNKETYGMIGRNEIAMMKDGVILINAARGGIIEENSLIEALKSGKVSAAGIDTWNQEPPRENPFIKLPNVVMTPHIGASTTEAQEKIAEFIADQVPKALEGGVVDAPVNMPKIRMIEGNLMSSYVVLSEKLGSFAQQFIDFTPDSLECMYRGDIIKHDCTLLRLAFLKGFLGAIHKFVSYVNADQRAESIGIKVKDFNDPSFSDYENAVKFTFNSLKTKQSFNIGGVVFSGPHPRITLVDGFTYEVEPSGTFILVRCEDKMGVLSKISTVFDKHKKLITRTDFSHSKERKRTMFMFRLAGTVSDDVINDLKNTEYIRMVKKIVI
ncbi:MAG TPA: phosphoglycerate dehydrogenase [Victivallales bacterium]|nr:phosphoglycerate dehydrogenase [Victivallales bacterium]